MQQASVVIILSLRKTPRLSLWRAFAKPFARGFRSSIEGALHVDCRGGYELVGACCGAEIGRGIQE